MLRTDGLAVLLGKTRVAAERTLIERDRTASFLDAYETATSPPEQRA